MKINSINKLNFKNLAKTTSNKSEICEKIGFSDSISDDIRKEIRKFQEEKYFAKDNLLTQEYRISEWKLNQLISGLTAKPKEVNYEHIMNMPISNVRPINDNSYRGASLVDAPKCVKTLKNAGIERVVDIVGYNDYKKSVLANGMEYLSPNLGTSTGFWFCAACFFSYKDFLARYMRFAYNEKDKEAVKKMVDEEFPEEVKKSKAEVIKFIKFMQKDYVYIGCECGTYKTDMALLLNNALNPKSEIGNIYYPDEYILESLKNFYYHLTPEDKKEMGWNDEFDKNFIPKINLAIAKLEKEPEKLN